MCKSMNHDELKALMLIVKKLSWNDKPALEVIETITQMVRNQQSLELDTVGECDDFEKTLLSMATWSVDKIVSTQFVSDYASHCLWPIQCFCDEIGITPDDYCAMLTYYNCIQPEVFEMEDEAYEEYLNDYYSDYDAEIMRDAMWMNNHC